MTGREFIMRSLSGQQWPRSSLSPLNVRSAVRPLAIAVVIVAAPTRACRGIHLERCIHHAQARQDQRVISGKDAITNQLQKSRIDDVASRIGGGRSLRLAGQFELRQPH